MSSCIPGTQHANHNCELPLILLVLCPIVSGETGGEPSSLLPPLPSRPAADYLLDASTFTAKQTRDANNRTLTLENGLVRRVWMLAPNGACIALDNLMTSQSMLRSVHPEARVTIDGVSYEVGGLVGQPNHAYLTEEWLAKTHRSTCLFL